MYNNSLKGQPVIAESSTYGPATPLRDLRGGRGNSDPRSQRSGSAPNRMRRARRSPPNQEYDAGGYRDYEVDRRLNAPPHWSAYNQQPMQHAPQQPGPWTGGGQQGDVGMDNVGPERVVVYSTTPAENYGGGQYYNNAYAGGNAWGGYPNVNSPAPQPHLAGAYPQQYSGAYGETQPPPGNRPYGNYHSSDRPNTSIERVTANLRNQMSNQ